MAGRLNVIFLSSLRIMRGYSSWSPFHFKNIKLPQVSHSCSIKKTAMVDSGEDSFCDPSTFDCLESKSFSPDEYFEVPPLLRRQSTIEDEQRLVLLLKKILSYQDKNVTSWIVENYVKDLVCTYKLLTKPQKETFLKILATDYSVDHERIHKAMNQFKDFEPGTAISLKAEEQLKSVLNPQYSWLFKHIGRLENGVKFLVDMRTDVLDLLSSLDSKSEAFIPIKQLNTTLRELLSLWFSVGFLKLERVTWKSPCEMLQKISEYEAVHPVRSWADLKRRVGAYRRCFVYTHSSMPTEPIVVLHTALSNEISSSMKGIVTAAHRMSIDASTKDSLVSASEEEDPNLVTAAIFYSISSTQRGLQGIELGNYLIKRVVQEVQAEFPKINQLSTLSPIPGFKAWLMEKIKLYEKDDKEVPEGWKNVLQEFGSWRELKLSLLNNSWYLDHNLMGKLEPILMSSCAYYLYKEKRRSGALDSVANFHLKNGAVMWRLNWMADTSPRGLSNSCGMMVNYRYILEDTERNSQCYLEHHKINASDEIKHLAGERIPSKM